MWNGKCRSPTRCGSYRRGCTEVAFVRTRPVDKRLNPQQGFLKLFEVYPLRPFQQARYFFKLLRSTSGLNRTVEFNVLYLGESMIAPPYECLFPPPYCKTVCIRTAVYGKCCENDRQWIMMTEMWSSIFDLTALLRTLMLQQSISSQRYMRISCALGNLQL